MICNRDGGDAREQHRTVIREHTPYLWMAQRCRGAGDTTPLHLRVVPFLDGPAAREKTPGVAKPACGGALDGTPSHGVSSRVSTAPQPARKRSGWLLPARSCAAWTG